MNLAIHDNTGRIIQVCTAPSRDGFEHFEARGMGVVEVGASVKDSTHYISGGAAVAMPERTSPQHEFDYTAKVWLDRRTIEQLRASKWADIKAARTTAEYGGFEFQGKVYDSGQASVQRITTAAQAASAAAATGTPFIRDWTLKDNSTVILDAENMVGLFIALDAHVSGAHARAAGLRVLIDTATTRAELDAIAW